MTFDTIKKLYAPVTSGYYIPIQITNTQNTGTPSPFQFMLNISPADIGTSLFSSDLGNIRFYGYAMNSLTPLYAWLESGNSPSSSNTVIWVNLPNGIPANSSTTIYMVLLPVGTEYDGNYMGLAPQLSSTYAQYDNGALVFNNYWNFAGTSLPSGWVSSPSSDVTVTVNNGVSVTQIVAGTGAYGREGISLNTASSGTYIVDAYMAENGNDNGGGLALQNAEASSLTSSSSYTSIFLIYSYPSSLTWYFSYQNPSGTQNNPTSGSFTAGTYYIASLLISGSNASAQVNYGSTANFGSETGYTNTGYISFVPSTATAGTNSQISAYWIRERTYVPSMPTYSIGSTLYEVLPTGSYYTNTTPL